MHSRANPQRLSCEPRHPGRLSRGASSSSLRVRAVNRGEPRKYASLEEARKVLNDTPKPGFIFSFLNFVSNTGIGRKSLQPWWSPARLVQVLLRPLKWQVGRDSAEVMPKELLVAMDARREHLSQLSGLLLLPKSAEAACLQRMVKAWPTVLDMPIADIAVRLVVLKDALPGVDACYLLERYPWLFLADDTTTMHNKVKQAATKLRTALAGAHVSRLIEDDPELLFMGPRLDHGLRQLKDLWPNADAQCFANSEPHELAFAVRALCMSE